MTLHIVPTPTVDAQFGEPTVGAGLVSRWATRVHEVGFVDFVARAPREAAQDAVDAAVQPGRSVGEHLHLANAYSVALAQSAPDLATALHATHGWNLPDGKPVTWVSALRGDTERLRQVRGPQFMLDVLDLGRASGLRHYLLGGTPETLDRLQESILRLFPGVAIVGAESPPFRVASAAELLERDGRILDSGAQIVWIGLGTPKQDVEALRLASGLPVLAVAVGAAFDFAAGTVRPAPAWISAIGFEWLWRMLSEPRRLWRRYTFGSARFLATVIAAERVRHRSDLR